MTPRQAPFRLRTRIRRAALPLVLLIAFLAEPAAAIRLCMLSPVVPFEEDDARTTLLERKVSAHFERVGIEISPSAEVKPLIETVDARSGAILDPATGRIDVDREAIHDADLEKSYRESLGCDGLVQTGVLQVMAWYGGANAIWDGRTVQVNSGARIAGQILSAVASGVVVYESGWIPALSVFVHVFDFEGNDVAFRTAGIEPLQNFSISRGHDVVPRDRWLADEKGLEKAIEIALGSGIERLQIAGRPDGTPAPDFAWK